MLLINNLNSTLTNNVYSETRYESTNRFLEQLEQDFLILEK